MISIVLDGVPIYSLGADEVNDKYLLRLVLELDVGTPDYIAYDYTAGDWEGSGVAIAKVGDSYYYSSLSHCSCYGPGEDGFEAFNIDDTSVLSPSLSKVLYEFIESKRLIVG